jgi:hypothetical protein
LRMSIKFSATWLIISALALLNKLEACRHNGITYRNGDEWVERSSFIMRCTIQDNGSWRTEVIACKSPVGAQIPLGTSIEDGNDEWKCQMNEQGMVVLIQGANPNARCDGRPVGTIWQEKSFELECMAGGVRHLVSCVTEDGQRVPVNGSREINGFDMMCQQFGNGTVIFHGKSSANSGGYRPEPNRPYGQGLSTMRCTDENGSQHNVGDYWIENHRFNKTCRSNGAVEVINCVSSTGYKIPLNGQLIKDGAKYSCEMTPQGTIRFAAGPVDS